MDKIEHLTTMYTEQLNDEDLIYEKKITEPEEWYRYIPFLEYTNVRRALYQMYIEHDYIKTKASFYKAARVAQYMSDTYDSRVMDNGMFQISYAMFSDNEVLIDRYSRLKNKINNDTSMPYQYSNCIQNILAEDWDKLDWNIHCLTRFVKMKQFESFAGVVNILNGFKAKDEVLIKKGLEDFIATAKKRNKDGIISKFFSIDTAGFCKLAWIKGYEIDLKSQLVPAELMPIEPLDYYPEYDFLKAK
ncbi:Imm49 family immunity protein [Mucilaginibacter aquariorum]|uniref:Immunity 49 family protein n=1 Tax=Mucilaginibacter aquariorum TaxID=2967225 RepID=A0ABT1T2I8_9SPHI|nr:Imm49 family immunity protein [Mucilaginibacter aquariorum]MCQ6958809.1 immunity 49 family protein [Mucilaginibacter aquariorum]